MKTKFKLETIIDHLKDDQKDGLLKLAKGSNVNIDDLEVKRATNNLDFADAFTEGESAIVQWVTTRAVDRDGEIVVPKGGVLDQFKQAPVVLWGHDYSRPPIGRDEWLKVQDNGIIAKSIYASTPFAQECFQLRKEGCLKTSSIGFIPLEWTQPGEGDWEKVARTLSRKWEELKDGLGHVNRVITKWAMLEHSDVAVPANPGALQIAISKGYNEVARDIESAIIKSKDEKTLEALAGDGTVTDVQCAPIIIRSFLDHDCGSDEHDDCDHDHEPVVKRIDKKVEPQVVKRLAPVQTVTKLDTSEETQKELVKRFDKVNGKV